MSNVVPVLAAVRCAAIVALSRMSRSAPSTGARWSQSPAAGFGGGGDILTRGRLPVGGGDVLLGGDMGEPLMRGGMLAVLAAKQSPQARLPGVGRRSRSRRKNKF